MHLGNLLKSFLILTSLILIIVIPSFADDTGEAPTRDQIDDKYKWDLTDFYPSDSAWQLGFDEFTAKFPEIEQFKGKLGESAENLLACLNLNDTLGNMVHRLYVYANLKADEDNLITKYQELSNQTRTLYSKYGQSASYIDPEILSISKDKIDGFIAGNDDLAVYKFYLDDMFRRQEHVLSEKEERILSLASPALSGARRVFNMMETADISFPNVTDEDGKEVELTRGRYGKLLESKNRDVRREASSGYNSAFTCYVNALGTTLATSVAGDWFGAQARGYNTCLEASLDANNIPTSVFHNIIAAANDNLAPLHKYTLLRKKFLGVDTLFGFDMYVPLVENVQLEYQYDDAAKLVLDALKPLGKDYVKNIKMAIDSRWIDVYETKGKGTGGYSWGTETVHPIILLNWANSLDNVFTLAHELGHAMHSHYTYQNEPSIYVGHSLFAAEVASTCNEALMIDYMLKRAKTKNEKLYILNHYINSIIGTFYTQLFFSEFEHSIHETVEGGGALSQESMRKVYRDVYQKYYGPDYFIPEGRDMGCLRIGHFYRQYYVYQYATSFAASQVLAQRILDGDKKATEAYIEFIATGTSDYPINILKKAGIDMTTTEPFENVVQILGGLVDQFEKLLLEG